MSIPPDATLQTAPMNYGQDRLAADLHMAEYRAVRAELAYWITLQYATYSVALIFVGIVVRYRNSTQIATVIWACTFALQLIGWAWLQTACEIASHALYVEKHLKPIVREMIRDDRVWGWEEYLQGLRRKRLVWFEARFGLLIPYVAALGMLAYFNFQKVSRPWGLGDWLWAILSGYIFGLTIVKGLQANDLARRLASSGNQVQRND